MLNWCQNRKNHNFKRNKILQTVDFKGFAKKHEKISTHLLTVLIISAILQLEQRKRKKFRTSFVPVTEQHQDLFQSAYRQCTRDRFSSCTLTTLFSIVIRKGDMTYVNA